MADGASADGQSARDWMLEQVGGEGPALIVSAQQRTGDGDRGDRRADAVDVHKGQDGFGAPAAPRDLGVGQGRPHDLDAPAEDRPSTAGCLDANAGAKRAAVWLGAGVLLVAVLIVLALTVFGGGPDPAPPPQHHMTTPAVAAAPTAVNLPVPQQDRDVPFGAGTDSCTPAGGSADELAARSPWALTDTGTDSAWVCGRGPQESLLDGQILHVQFTCDPSRPNSACSYMLNSLAVTPGWVAKTPAGKEEWSQHRVVTRLQFNFFNGNQLAADPFFLDTHSVHGPVSATLPARILVSRVDVVVLHTDQPPAAPQPTGTGPGRGLDITDPPPPGGLADSVVGPAGPEPAAPPPPPAEPAAGATTGDAVDATFAISRMQFFGHSPT